jgi:hypothetical protein
MKKIWEKRNCLASADLMFKQATLLCPNALVLYYHLGKHTINYTASTSII